MSRSRAEIHPSRAKKAFVLDFCASYKRQKFLNKAMHAASQAALQKLSTDLCQSLHSQLTFEEMRSVERALHLCTEVHMAAPHHGIQAALHTAQIVAEELQLDAASVISTLLSSVKDCVSDRSVGRLFGEEVVYLRNTIQRATRIQPLESFQLPIPVSDKHAHDVTELAQDMRAMLIKLAQYLHAMRDLSHFSHKQQRAIALCVENLYMPIAHRLGLYKINTELANLRLKFAYPTAYADIECGLAAMLSTDASFFLCAQDSIAEVLRKGGFSFKLKARVKSVASLYQKMRKLNIPLADVYDVFAIRIIVQSSRSMEKRLCWRVFETITAHYRPHPTKFRNWISYPRSNGYASLHVVVRHPAQRWIEIQVRTQRMDRLAECGMASHWSYKGSKPGGGLSLLDGWLHRVREHLEQSDTYYDDESDVQRPKSRLTFSTIQVFAVGCGTLVLPYRATVLDLAFHLNAAQALRCAGAYVNGWAVPLHQIIEHKDHVELIFTDELQVEEEWLEIVATLKAHNVLKHFLTAKRKRSVRSGWAQLSRALAYLGFEYDQKMQSRLLKDYRASNAEEFHQQVTLGSLAVKDVEEAVAVLASRSQAVKTSLSWKESVKLRAMEHVLITRAGRVNHQLTALCCKPVPSDAPSLLIHRDGSTEIHRKYCPVMLERVVKESKSKMLPAQWNRRRSQHFTLCVRVEDNHTILDKLLSILIRNGFAAVEAVHTECDGRCTQVRATCRTLWLDGCNMLTQTVEKMPGVVKVSRDTNRLVRGAF